MSLSIFFAKQLLKVIGTFKGEKYKYSQECEDNFKYMDIQEKLWWGYKALIKQIENGEKGKKIEEYFRNQDLIFNRDSSFKAEKTATITAGGDLSTSEILKPDSLNHLWDDVEQFYFSGDIVCSNLETPLYQERLMSGVPIMCLTAPGLNTTPEMFECFARSGKGVNFFATANNHSLDMGEEGLVSTLDFLDSKGYKHVGTSRSPEEQRNIPIIEKNGIKIAFLSYTYCLNGKDPIPGKEYMTNALRLNKPDTDISLIKEHVQIAHEKGADMIAAMLHWSIEFETYPIENVIKMGHRIMECGVDIILGGHPHVAQPMEKYNFVDPFTGREKEGFIIYSFGELVSYNAFSRNSRLALLLKLEVSKGNQEGENITRINKLQVLPIYTLVRKLENGEYDYRLLDFINTLSMLNKGENPFGFTAIEIKEFKRLEELLFEKLLPKCASAIIQKEGLGGISYVNRE